MKRHILSSITALMVAWVASVALGLEAVGSFRSTEGDVLVVFANGQERRLLIDRRATFLDSNGRPLPEGIRSKEFMPNADVTITAEFEDGRPVLRTLQLGHRPLAPRAGGPVPAKGGPTRALLARPTTGLVPLKIGRAHV